ncbi:MAG TPA: HAD family hydrolase [bacterium]|nr:HAD family hydrolase [bacterium]HQL60673.1 HAD family hydrolase [bacterium]
MTDTTGSPVKGTFLPGTQIEIINPDIVRGQIKFALFDFDGTLSLIREGWQQVMIPMMVEILQSLDTGESEEELRTIVTDFVTRLTGKQTIYQMIELAEQIKKRGHQPKEPLEYKYQYLDLLWTRIKDRVHGLESGELQPLDWMVPGAMDILRELHKRNVTMYLASGTDRPYVLNESGVLGLHPYFGDAERIYGALDDYKSFSKRMIIQKILKDNNLSGPGLVTFGDGYVEIEDTKTVGGIAVGVATNEAERAGIDEWKRNRLIQAGADIIMPDFREAKEIVAYLFNES